MRRLLLLAPLLLCGAECQDGPGVDVPGRTIRVDLLDPGPNVTERRSQDSGLVSWDGDDELLFVPMRRPVAVSAHVFDADGGDPLADVCIFLDTGGTLSDLAKSSDSTGSWGYGIVPGIYDVLVAPGCLVGASASLAEEELQISTATAGAPLEWTLPPALPVHGRVISTDAAGDPGDGVPGATVTVYRTGEPEPSLGIAVTTGTDGAFSFDLPQGFYDLTVSTPWNGLVAIAPVRSENRPLPPTANLELGIKLPYMGIQPVRGSLEDGAGNVLSGRVRIEGDIAPRDPPLVEYAGGTFRAEFDTDGEWTLDLPEGLYTASAVPPHPGARLEQTLGLASADFVVVDPNVGPPPDDVALIYGEPRLGRVVVLDPEGLPAEADVNLRMTSPPHYAYQLPAGEDGILVASLIPDLYEVEVLPARDVDGNKVHARAHGQLDLREANAEVEIQIPRSDVYEGVVVTADQGQIGHMKVVLRDPETGKIVDDSLSDNTERFRGFFRGVMPRAQ